MDYISSVRPIQTWPLLCLLQQILAISSLVPWLILFWSSEGSSSSAHFTLALVLDQPSSGRSLCSTSLQLEVNRMPAGFICRYKHFENNLFDSICYHLHLAQYMHSGNLVLVSVHGKPLDGIWIRRAFLDADIISQNRIVRLARVQLNLRRCTEQKGRSWGFYPWLGFVVGVLLWSWGCQYF